MVDRNGIVWTAGSRSHKLISFDPKQGQIKSSYPITEEKTFNDDSHKGISLMVWTMVEDNDGFIWFSQFGPNSLCRFDPHTKTFDIFEFSDRMTESKVRKNLPVCTLVTVIKYPLHL